MHYAKRMASFLIAVLMVCAYGVLAFAADAEPLTITASSDSVNVKKTITLSTNASGPVTWKSSDTSVAEVDAFGVVTGVSYGTATITATADDGRTAEYLVYVMRQRMPWRTLLENHQILGYRYNYKGDYYYTDDRDCWQKHFGFNFAYDWIAPLILLEYDYVRIFFPYEGKDWMIQMWKGQYGMVFYGSEVGVYNKPEGDKSATRYSHYQCAEEPDYLKISNALYRENRTTGEYEFEFENPYDDHWWNTGFVPGHLWDTTPCNELLMVSRITFKDEEMAKLFTDGLLECDFDEVHSVDAVRQDTFFRDGADVHLQWQNISEAANSHVVQTAFYGPVAVVGAVLIVFLIIIMIAVLVFGGVGILIMALLLV